MTFEVLFMIFHPIAPVYDSNSRILILGSFPSVKSREEGFFYGHKQNRFWRVIASVFDEPVPASVDDKTKLLINNNVALWDVIKSCDIVGSSDSSISDVQVNDISEIIDKSQIKYIFTNGKKADELYRKYIEANVGIRAVSLPSTSPANAIWSFERLSEFWSKQIKSVLAKGDFYE